MRGISGRSVSINSRLSSATCSAMNDAPLARSPAGIPSPQQRVAAAVKAASEASTGAAGPGLDSGEHAAATGQDSCRLRQVFSGADRTANAAAKERVSEVFGRGEG